MGLRPDQIDRIAAAIAKGYNLMAGDAVTHVTAAGKQTSLLTIKFDVPANNKYNEGLQIDNAGMMLHGAQEITLLSSYLEAKGVTLDVTDHWLINGERWDYVKDAPLIARQVPINAIHNLITVYVRRAVEQEQASKQTGDFAFS